MKSTTPITPQSSPVTLHTPTINPRPPSVTPALAGVQLYRCSQHSLGSEA